MSHQNGDGEDDGSEGTDGDASVDDDVDEAVDGIRERGQAR